MLHCLYVSFSGAVEQPPYESNDDQKRNYNMRATVGFSCQEKLLSQIDIRAEELGLTRSGYIQMLVRQDVIKFSGQELAVAVAPKKKRR